MSGVFMKILISFIISTLMLFVPKDKYQNLLDALPDMAHKAYGHNLYGWTYSSLYSEASKTTHWYYSFPVADSSAPVLLLLHGFNTDGRTFLHLSELSKKFRLIAYNFPEESPLYKGEITDFVPLLDDFCAALKVDTIWLAGNSIGGAIAQCYTANTKKVVVDHLFLWSTQVFGATADDRARNAAMASKLLPYPDYKLYYLLNRASSLIDLMDRRGFGADAPAEIIVIRRIGWYRQILNSVKTYDGSETAHHIRCPVIVLHGSNDKVIPLVNANLIPGLIPQSRFEVIDKAGHAMVFVQGPQIARRILSILESSTVF